ncbi:MAG: class I SAM-dependent methyltransferase [Melioribacteraceae bacterium]|nr:class I SAM-dependent methyltransferase [Melioribacteraceae bacterium]
MRDYRKMWDERYSQNDLIYGKEPNQYFKEVIDKIKPGKLFMPGDGEGRNSIYAAKNNWEVTSVDYSSVAVEKAKHYAQHDSVNIELINADLSVYEYLQDHFDAVGIIFLHLQSPQKVIIHTKIVNSIKPGGAVILEVFSNNQLQHGSGGPRNKNALYTIEEIAEYYKNFDIEELDEKTIELNESKSHSGPATVIRLYGIKK